MVFFWLVQGFEEVFASLGAQPSAESSLIPSLFLKRIQKITEVFLRMPGLEDVGSPTLWTAHLPFWPLLAPASPPLSCCFSSHCFNYQDLEPLFFAWVLFPHGCVSKGVLVVSVSVSARPYLTWLTPLSQFVAELCSSLVTSLIDGLQRSLYTAWLPGCDLPAK